MRAAEWSAGRRRPLRQWGRAPPKRLTRVTGLSRGRAAGSVNARRGRPYRPGASRRSIPFWGRKKGSRPPRAVQRAGAAERWLSDLLSPQPCRRNVGAFADRAQLEPHRRLDHPFSIRERAESAIGAGDDALALADRGDRVFD